MSGGAINAEHARVPHMVLRARSLERAVDF
jgi:hypothetical protein